MKDIKYLVLSDIHLGHRNNKTLDIVNNLIYYFKVNNKLFKTLDIIFLAGDVFDRLLSTNSEEYLLAVEWLSSLISYCKLNNIKLRLLEGTPSHDWKQSKVVTTILQRLDINIDFKYIESVSIEKMSDLGINILYIPDEANHKATDTLDEVSELLVKNNLSQVDIAIMHGQFNYQLPILLECSHDENSYLDIVKYYISIGHVHTASVFKRILAEGSFDRLTHGEEEDKGGMVITIGDDPSFEFIVNKKAKIFKTLDVKNHNEPLKYIINMLKGIPSGGFIRILAERDSDMKVILKEIQDRYKNYSFKIEYNDENDVALESMNIDNSVNIETFEITKDNIAGLLFKELGKHKLDNKLMDIGMLELDGVLNELS